MYLVGFVLFVVLGKHRARQNLLTGWHPRDVDDMLLYGVFGVILGGRLGLRAVLQAALLSREPARDPFRLAGRHELPRRLSRRPGGAVVLRALAAGNAGSTSPISWRRSCRSALPPAVSATSSTASCGGARPTCLGGWCFREAGPEPRHPSQLYQFGLEGLLLFAVLWIYTRRRRPLGAASGLFLVGYGLCRFVGRVCARAGQLPRATSRSASRWANGYRCR